MLAKWSFLENISTKNDFSGRAATSSRQLDLSQQGFHSNLFWWHCFLDRWNGTSVLHSYMYAEPAEHIFRDASGKWRCGATWNEVWFQAAWSKEWIDINIAMKELVPPLQCGVHSGTQYIQFYLNNILWLLEPRAAKIIASCTCCGICISSVCCMT